MDLIPSFQVDHTKIVPGIYISRVDKVGDELVTTYDIRLKRPNIEPAMDVAAMHSLEHIIATYLRSDIHYDEVIYWGPMGCLTGFHLILKGNRQAKDTLPIIYAAFSAASVAESIPGVAPECCGHYTLHDLEMAKYYAKEFVAYLWEHSNDPDIFEYPKTEVLVTDDGKEFHDS